MLLLAGLLPARLCAQTPPQHAWEIRDGKFYRNGEWIFLKVGKPLRNFADTAVVERLIDDWNVLKAKHYNTIEINCYWHHFDRDSDGMPDVSHTAIFCRK